MNILLDTHALVWWLTRSERLSSVAKEAIASFENTVFVSAATAWEIASKHRSGRWPEAGALLDQFPEIVLRQQFQVIAVAWPHAVLAGRLPGNHRDPFDRMLAAQCQIEGLPLVTVDPAFSEFGTSVIW